MSAAVGSHSVLGRRAFDSHPAAHTAQDIVAYNAAAFAVVAAAVFDVVAAVAVSLT